MFIGPLEQVKPWQTNGVAGMARFLSQAYRLVSSPADNGAENAHNAEANADQLRVLHRTNRQVRDDTEAMRFNTAISAMIEFVNAATKWKTKPRAVLGPFLSMLGVYAPHVAEELWYKLW